MKKPTVKPRPSTRSNDGTGKVRSRKSNAEFFAVDYAPQVRYQSAPLVPIYQYFEKGVRTGEGRHADFFALYIVQSGRAVHLIDGHPYPASRGDVYISPPGSAHIYLDYHGLRAHAFCFQASFFSLDELKALCSLPHFGALFVPRDEEQTDREKFVHGRLHLSPSQLEDALQIVEEIKVELRDASPQHSLVSPLLARGAFFRLMVFLARSSTRTDEARAQTRVLDFRDVLQLCETRFYEKLSVPQLAQLMSYSTARFHSVFKRETGVAPATYIRRLRLGHAQKLLRTTSLPTLQIARQCGFADGAELARVFTRDLKISPRAYRKLVKQTDGKRE